MNFIFMLGFILQDILTQLRAIFDLIIQFQSIQDNMYLASTEELLARQGFDDKVKANTEKVAY